MSKLQSAITGAVAMVISLAASAPGSSVLAADGIWLDGSGKSCQLVCKANGRTAWVSGRYRDSHQIAGLPGESDYVVCRVRANHPSRKYATRPGFQHQSGSPNVCKVQGVPLDEGGSAKINTADVVSAEVLSLYECLCH